MSNAATRAKTFEGLGLFVGVMIGAGLFALPYSFSRAGLVWGSAFFVLVLAASAILHFLYAAIVFHTPGRHRFAGYMKIYLGPAAEKASMFFTLFGSYGSMLAYGVLGGIFLNIITGIDFFYGGILFLVFGGGLFFMSLKLVGKINFYLTVPLIIFILVLAARLFPSISGDNLVLFTGFDRLLPYGVLLFAFSGYSSIPDLHDVLGAHSLTLSKKIIFWGILLSALVYLIFILSIFGTLGSNTTQDSLSGLGVFAGSGAVLIGSVIGLLAVFTSYVVFGADLKLALHYDYNFSGLFSWLLSFVPPLLLFLLGFTDLVRILGVVGSVGLGISTIFVIWVSFLERQKLSSFLGFTPRAWWLLPLGVLIALGALQGILF